MRLAVNEDIVKVLMNIIYTIQKQPQYRDTKRDIEFAVSKDPKGKIKIWILQNRQLNYKTNVENSFSKINSLDSNFHNYYA